MADDALKKALKKISYGMYVVASRSGDRLNGQIVNTLVQVTGKPPCVSVCVNKENLTHEFIAASGVFSISILEESVPPEFIGLFGFKSGRDVDKLSKVNYKLGVTGAPIVTDYAIAAIEVKLRSSIDVGAHTIFVGDVVNAEFFKEGEPLTYGNYHLIKGGKTPKSAATYIEETIEKKESDEKVKEEQKIEERSEPMKKYKCNICGYIYDPANGDKDGNIPPGTPFEKLPEDWVCPVCGASKSEFEPLD